MKVWRNFCVLILASTGVVAGCARDDGTTVINPSQVYEPTAEEQRNQEAFDELRQQRE